MIRLKAKIHPNNRWNLSELIKKIGNLKPGDYKVYVCDDRPSRSLNQNAYYWSVVIPIIAGEIGYQKEELHEALKIKFLPKEIKVKGKPYTIGGSTGKLNTKQFNEYLEAVIQMASELGIYIPEPGEYPDEVLINATN